MIEFVYVVTVGAGDDSKDPSRDIVGVYSTPEAAEAVMLAEAPGSGAVDKYRVDSKDSECLMWREWDWKTKATVTKRTDSKP